MDIIEVLKIILIGFVEGITEWLPVSSTGHILLVEAFLPLKDISADFKEMFEVVIQLGAILAVIVIFWKRIWPFVGGKKGQPSEDGMRTVTSDGTIVLSVSSAWHKFCAHAVCFFRTVAWGARKLFLGKKFPADEQKPVVAYVADRETPDKAHAFYIKKDVLWMWWMVVVSSIPTAIFGFLLDDILNEYLYNAFVIALMLIVYGIAFLVVEEWNKHRSPRIETVRQFDWQTAFIIGLFQCLAMIPGTSRSGATIIGALIIGVTRTAAAEFTFFLAIVTMFGASGLKLVKYFLETGFGFSAVEGVTLFIGMLVAFGVSLFVIRFLMDFVKKHSFKGFGWYRIALGVAVIIIFAVRGDLFEII
jgi:undecaprenyl-diphosphatase